MSKPIIFCDFDGTITDTDNIIAIMKQFAPPEWNAIKDDVLSQNISVKEGVGKMFSLLPTSSKEEIIDFILGHAKIRDGFKEFVSFTREHDIPLFIVSGGIDFFVYPLLQEFGPFSGVYCNESNFDGQTIEILWPHTCDDQCSNHCGCCKPSLLRKLASKDQRTIVIGDSITDLQIAKQADYVFARDFLLEKCKELKLPHTPFESFFECITQLEKELEVQV